MPHIHSISFVSPYGKIWELDYTMESRDTVSEILEVRIDGTVYKSIPFARENRIIRLAAEHGADLYEYAADWVAENRTNHHLIDN